MNNLSFRKAKPLTKGAYQGCNRWTGEINIDDNLTLYYEIIEGNVVFHTTVGSDRRFKNGFYYDCEDCLDSLENSIKAIDEFVSMVKQNPNAYYPEDSLN